MPLSSLTANPFTGEDPYKRMTVIPSQPVSDIPTVQPKKPMSSSGGLVAGSSNNGGVKPAATAVKSSVSSVAGGDGTFVAQKGPETPIAPTVTKTDMVDGGMMQTLSDGTQKFTPMQKAPVAAAPRPTPTIDTAGARAAAANATPAAPELASNLNANDQAAIQAETDAKIEQARQASAAEVQRIKDIGRGKLASSKIALGTIGALGRTISGMPVETGLGVLSEIQDNIEKAIQEENGNLQSKIVEAQTGGKVAAQKRLDELNKLAQTNWENALKFIEEDRTKTESEKKSILDDLNIKKLQSDIANDTEAKNVATVTAQIERLAEGGVPLDQLSTAQIAEYEKKLGIPAGAFTKYYQAQIDYAKMATEENKIKLDQAKANLEKTKEASEKLTTKTVKVGSGKTSKTYLISYDQSGKEVGRELVDGSGGGGGGGNDNGNGAPVGISKADQAAINQALKSAAGTDQKVSPQDYAQAKEDWIARGGTPTEFDTKMKGYRNPDNPNYGTNKTPKRSGF